MRWSHGAQGIRNLGERYQPRLWTKELLVLIEQNLAIVVDGGYTQASTLFRTQHLPGNNIGVMLNPTDDDLIALIDVAPSPCLGDQVDGLGRAAHEYDLFRGGSVEEVCHLDASVL